MATTRDQALRRWIHAEHGRYFAGFADRRVLLEAFQRFDLARRRRVRPRRRRADACWWRPSATTLAPAGRPARAGGRFPDARLVVVPGAGHLTHYEAPAAVAAAIIGVRRA